MRHAALIGLLAVSIAACGSRSEQRLQQLYESATAQLWRGELTRATSGAKEGANITSAAPGSPWAWRFTLLDAETRLVGRDVSAASALLNESPPGGPGFEAIAAKHRYLQGQLALLQGRLAEARTILDDAAHLAERASAADVSLEIGAMKGQVLILQRKWEEAESTLSQTIEQARQRRDRYREAVALVNLGGAHLFRNRFDHALQFFERVLALENLCAAARVRRCADQCRNLLSAAR